MPHLRPFRWRDLDSLLALRNADPSLESGQIPASRAGLEAAWRGQGIEAEQGDLWLAEEAGLVVAYGGLRPWHDRDWLQAELVVHPDWRGRGLGRALMRRLLAQARRRDVRYVAAVADDQPGRGRQFLEEQGFQVFVPRQHMRLRPIVVPEAREAPGYRLRLGNLADCPALAEVNNAAYGVGGRISQADAAGYRRYLQESQVRVWVVERLARAHVVGLCEVREREVLIDGAPIASGHIGSLAVHPAWQGHGLGRWLLAAGIQDCLQAGWPSVELNVDRDNPPALHLYESAGFRPVYRYAIYRLAVNSEHIE